MVNKRAGHDTFTVLRSALFYCKKLTKPLKCHIIERGETMKDVFDFAKYFIKIGADTTPNTYDGNMKLQKLLMFANFACIAEYGELLFDEPMLAFKNGCVVEKVRLRYKNDYSAFKQESDSFQPNFTEKEQDILNITMKVFGVASAKELSELSHLFDFWKTAHNNSILDNGHYDKDRAIVHISKNSEDAERMRDIIHAFRNSKAETLSHETINGVTFYYDNSLVMTDTIISKLEDFSLSADEDAYSVYMDNGALVVY